MKKRFLPFSLLLVIMILGQSVIADQGGHYVPRKQINNAESFMGSLRANQKTGLIDPADMLRAMQAPATRNASNDPLYWINMGPDNMGGQTTAIVYDNRKNPHGNPNGVVYIGSKGGGVYKTYNHGATWHQVGGLDLMVSCMVQDANGVIYVGTGDCDDAAVHNGLDQQNYDNSFIGTGLYTLTNDVFEQVVAPTEDAWQFVNGLAIADGKLLAATNEGLMYSTDGGHHWTTAIEGKAVCVKVGEDNTIVAAVGGHVYIGSDVTSLEDHSGTSNNLVGDTLLPQGVSGGMIDLAIATSDSLNVIYASFINANGVHTGIFVSEDKGDTWRTALPSLTLDQGHNVYGSAGLYNHGLVIDPENFGIVYVLGYDLWSLTANPGYYTATKLTSQSYYYMSDYIHVGIHDMVFNPNNSQECYVGTDGGIYKASGRFIYSNCNRNYTTSRMFNVAYSGKDTRVLAAGLDHGTVYIPGDPAGNTLETGYWVNPRSDANMGLFNEGSHAGSCAISSINANTIFATYRYQDDTENPKAWLARSQTLGEDWVSTNFTSGLSTTIFPRTTSFRIPVLLFENYNNQLNPETAWYFNETEHRQPAGTVVQVMSNNKYPFDYTLTTALAAGDSIEVHDPITSYFFLAVNESFLMTRTPLQFDKEAKWFRLADKTHSGFKGEPLCMDITADGDVVFVGFKDGKLFRISGLNSVVDANTGSITDSLYAATVTQITLPTSGQCVTSISVDPRNANKVIVTCGNYGNDDYVFYSTDAMAEEPTFVSKQGNLPKMPVYSSVIDMTTGDVIIGTERGIYRTKNLSTWTFDSEVLGEIPVMELKQQRHCVEDVITVKHTEEGDFVTEYPGAKNTGIIYAATYGRGIFRCENYKKDFASVPEMPSVDNNVNVNIYPNPVSSQATLSFELKESCNVSYQVFDMSGRMVMSQSMGRLAEGQHQINLSAENLSAGSYILRLSQGAKDNTVKFMVY